MRRQDGHKEGRRDGRVDVARRLPADDAVVRTMAVAVRAGAEMADTDSLRGALWVSLRDSRRFVLAISIRGSKNVSFSRVDFVGRDIFPNLGFRISMN